MRKDFLETLRKDLKGENGSLIEVFINLLISEIIHKIRTTNIFLMLLLLYTNIRTTSSLIDTKSPILPPSHKLFSHRPGSFQCPSKSLSKNFRLCHQHSHKVLKSLFHPICLPKLENSG